MINKVLILGANGMAGHVITTGLREDLQNFEVISVARTNSIIKPDILLDVTDFKTLEDLIVRIKPNVIINCVGLLNKAAEEQPDKAILLNSYLPHFLANITKNSLTKIIHISTDCVFSGNEGNYTEESPKNGIGFYAETKALGELINKKDLTIRTSIIGPELNFNGIGLFHWFFQQKKEINGYTNAFWTGITTIELLNALKVIIKEGYLIGLYHLVSNEKISKYNLLKNMNIVFNKNITLVEDGKYKVDKSLINTRIDCSFHVKEYDKMINEMNSWIKNHKVLYSHYYMNLE